jgi:hypothetical protein
VKIKTKKHQKSSASASTSTSRISNDGKDTRTREQDIDEDDNVDVQHLLQDTVENATARAKALDRKRRKRLLRQSNGVVDLDDEQSDDDEDIADINIPVSKVMYNPASSEAQHALYERNVVKLGTLVSVANNNNKKKNVTEETSNDYTSRAPLDEEAIQRVVQDSVQRKNQKRVFSRRRVFDADEDVTYINERNRRFNRKLERDYNDHTKELRQNIERGTAI